jgi:hypothetical protein
MSGLLITITVIFFAVGITFGVITTLAVSAVRAGRRARRDYGLRFEPGDEAEHEDGLRGEPAAGRGWDRVARDDRPRWPGDPDTGFRDRRPLTGERRSERGGLPVRK